MLYLSIIVVAALLIYARKHPAFWMLAWPGTVAHEFMHWAIGSLLLAQPGKFSVIPEKAVAGQPRTLGSVTFYELNWFNTIPVAIAPLLNIPLVFIVAICLPHQFSVGIVLAVWALGSALSQCWPSLVDWKLVASRPAGIAFWASVAGMVVYANYTHMV